MENSLPTSAEEMSPVLDKIIEETLWKLDSSKDPIYKSSSLALLVEIWINNPAKINQ